MVSLKQEGKHDLYSLLYGSWLVSINKQDAVFIMAEIKFREG